MIFELLWLESMMTGPVTVETVLMGMPWHKAVLHKKKKKGERNKKKDHKLKHHKKMHRRAVRHIRHMEKVQEAIRTHHRARKAASALAFGGGSTATASGVGMDQDMLGKADALKQKVQARVHQATRTKDRAAQQQINALRQRTHASRIRAQQRAKDVFGKGR